MKFKERTCTNCPSGCKLCVEKENAAVVCVTCESGKYKAKDGSCKACVTGC